MSETVKSKDSLAHKVISGRNDIFELDDNICRFHLIDRLYVLAQKVISDRNDIGHDY